MKTAVIWLDPEEGTVDYFVINDDWRQFHSMFINTSNHGKELHDEMYNHDGCRKHRSVSIDTFRQAIVDGAFLIECGFCS